MERSADTAPLQAPPPPVQTASEVESTEVKHAGEDHGDGPAAKADPLETSSSPTPAPAPETKKDDGSPGLPNLPQDLTPVEVEALKELKQSLQEIKLCVDNSTTSAASDSKEHLAATLTELKRILDSSIYSQPRLEAAMRDAFGPLQATVMPALNGLKSTLGPLPEHGADIRAIREVIVNTEDLAQRTLKAVEDSSWDQNGRLNALGTQLGTIGTDLSKGLQHAHRKLDSIHAAMGSRQGGTRDGGTDYTSILVAVKDLQTEMKAMNQNLEKLQTQVQYVEGRMETALSKLVAVEQSTSKLAATRPKAPPPNTPAPNLPSDEAPLPPPAQPPGQWQPSSASLGATTQARPTSIPAPTMRLAPHAQLLQPGGAGGPDS
ncbi:unnamed protein product [Symbiodinium sp. CCMP2592]|nr:unnamed protein product [Symbiodinium sp. CCMP2592]